MKLLAQLALLGTVFGQAQTQGPTCTAYKITADEAGAMQLYGKIMTLETPTTEDEKHEFIREHLYDVSKGECDDGLSCSIIMADPPVQACQKCNMPVTEDLFLAMAAVKAGQEPDIKLEKYMVNSVTTASGDQSFFMCVSDAFANKLIVSAGAAVLAAIATVY